MAGPTRQDPVPTQHLTNQTPSWAIIGGGNGGQSLAGHLALMGFQVRLYDIIPETIESIRSRGGITVNGAVEGFGSLECVTMDMEEALNGADIVMVVAPAVAHRSIALDCAPYLTEGSLVFLHPGATGGALEFRKVLDDAGCKHAITIAEANSLLYACRSSRAGYTSIFGIKKQLRVAALPSSDTERVLGLLNQAFPQMHPAENVMETSLGNPNAMMHPAPSLLNTSMIESGRDWLYYWDGITPSIGAFVEAMDRERVALAAVFGLKLPPILEWYRLAYGVVADSLSEVVKKNQAYAEVKGQQTLRTRYVLEDVPTGLVPMVSLGNMLGVEVSRMETIIRLAEHVLGEDLTSGGRTVANLGLKGMTLSEILYYLQTGSCRISGSETEDP
jgi:opine dehydrogenase